MSNLPETAEEFYARRDDRTNRCTASPAYQSASCAVFVSEAAASTAVGQVMLLAATNLLSRWCRRVTIVLPPTQALPSLGMGSGDLGSLVLDQMRDADPFGEFQVNGRGVAAADVTLIIGERPAAIAAKPTVFVGASGWLASLSLEGPIALPPASDGNLLGGIAAACLGVGQVFKIALGLPAAGLLRDGVFDLFRLGWSTDFRPGPWPEEMNIGRALMVGAGSVGSSAAYCMRLGGLAGSILIVDRDIVKIENLNRSPIFGCRTVGLAKAEAVSGFLAGSSLRANPIPHWWDSFLEQCPRSSFDFDVWLPLANEFDVRSAMQNHVPPLMIHASTGSNWGVNHARHIPGRDDCLADRFEKVISSSMLACSTGKVETEGAIVDAALPFASMFAGLLVAADLVRAQLPGYPQVPNFALFDWYGPLDTIQAWDRRARNACICREQGRSFHDKFNGDTRYRPLFQFAGNT